MEISNLWHLGMTFLCAVGLMALISPEQLMKISQSASRKFNFSSSFVDKAHFIDSKLYHSHRAVGIMMLMVSIATLYLVLFEIGDQPILQRSIETGEIVSGWALEVALVMAALGGIIGLCFGVVMLLRPSILKPLEAWGNRWFKFPEEMLDKEMGQSFDTWVKQNTRLFGGLVLLCTLLIWFVVFGLD